MEKDTEKIIRDLQRSKNKKGIRDVIIAELILAGLWTLAGNKLHYGTLMAIINIFCLIVSIMFSTTLMSFLNERLSNFISLVISVALWFLIFGVLRGLF